jgi:hypothetical protein
MGLELGIHSKLMRLGSKVPGLENLLLQLRSREKVFGKAYSTEIWGSTESRSGHGSELGATESLRLYLPKIFEELDIKTFLDAPCGDWNWMRKVDLSKVEYVGADVVPSVINKNQETYARVNVNFMVADLTRDKLPKSDLILCRDCWVHLSFRDISNIIENFRHSGAKYLLASNSSHVQFNENKITGLDWRYLNLSLAPFYFPTPLDSIKDHYSDVPFYTCLWRIEDLPVVRVR